MGCGSAKALQTGQESASHDGAVAGPSWIGGKRVSSKHRFDHRASSKGTPVEAGLVGSLAYLSTHMHDDNAKATNRGLSSSRENPYHEVRIQNNKIRPSSSSYECSSAKQYPNENFRVRIGTNATSKIRVTLSSDGSMLEVETEKLSLTDGDQNSSDDSCAHHSDDYVFLSQEPGVSGLSECVRFVRTDSRQRSSSSFSSSGSERHGSKSTKTGKVHHQHVHPTKQERKRVKDHDRKKGLKQREYVNSEKDLNDSRVCNKHGNSLSNCDCQQRKQSRSKNGYTPSMLENECVREKLLSSQNVCDYQNGNREIGSREYYEGQKVYDNALKIGHNSESIFSSCPSMTQKTNCVNGCLCQNSTSSLADRSPYDINYGEHDVHRVFDSSNPMIHTSCSSEEVRCLAEDLRFIRKVTADAYQSDFCNINGYRAARKPQQSTPVSKIVSIITAEPHTVAGIFNDHRINNNGYINEQLPSNMVVAEEYQNTNAGNINEDNKESTVKKKRSKFWHKKCYSEERQHNSNYNNSFEKEMKPLKGAKKFPAVHCLSLDGAVSMLNKKERNSSSPKPDHAISKPKKAFIKCVNGGQSINSTDVTPCYTRTEPGHEYLNADTSKLPNIGSAKSHLQRTESNRSDSSEIHSDHSSVSSATKKKMKQNKKVIGENTKHQILELALMVSNPVEHEVDYSATSDLDTPSDALDIVNEELEHDDKASDVGIDSGRNTPVEDILVFGCLKDKEQYPGLSNDVVHGDFYNGTQ